jgi:hypothetical protein
MKQAYKIINIVIIQRVAEGTQTENKLKPTKNLFLKITH